MSNNTDPPKPKISLKLSKPSGQDSSEKKEEPTGQTAPQSEQKESTPGTEHIPSMSLSLKKKSPKPAQTPNSPPPESKTQDTPIAIKPVQFTGSTPPTTPPATNPSHQDIAESPEPLPDNETPTPSHSSACLKLKNSDSTAQEESPSSNESSQPPPAPSSEPPPLPPQKPAHNKKASAQSSQTSSHKGLLKGLVIFLILLTVFATALYLAWQQLSKSLFNSDPNPNPPLISQSSPQEPKLDRPSPMPSAAIQKTQQVIEQVQQTEQSTLSSLLDSNSAPTPPAPETSNALSPEPPQASSTSSPTQKTSSSIQRMLPRKNLSPVATPANPSSTKAQSNPQIVSWLKKIEFQAIFGQGQSSKIMFGGISYTTGQTVNQSLSIVFTHVADDTIYFQDAHGVTYSRSRR